MNNNPSYQPREAWKNEPAKGTAVPTNNMEVGVTTSEPTTEKTTQWAMKVERRGGKGGWEELKHIGGSYFSEKLNELSKIGQQSLTAKQREAEEEDVIVEYKNNPMFSPDNEKVTFTDRIVFIATTFAFRAIALMLLNSAIHTRYITKFTQAFGYYFMIYSLLFVIWIAIVNIQQDNRLVGLLFYYVNTRYDSSIWFSRIGLHLVLQLLILPMPILLTPKFSSQSETDTFEQREHLYNTLTFFTFIIWFITSLIALRA
jgi:hypothetical protein